MGAKGLASRHSRRFESLIAHNFDTIGEAFHKAFFFVLLTSFSCNSCDTSNLSSN